MRLSTATVSLSGDLVSKMNACARAGFDGIELFEPDLVVAEQSPEEIRALAHRLGLRLELYQPLRDVEGTDPATFTAALRRAEAKFTLMRRLGIDTVLLCSNVATASTADLDVATDQLRQLGRLAAEHEVRVAYEALAWGRHIDDYRQAWQLVQAVDLENVGLCLDSFHILSRGHDPAAIEQIPGDRIFFVQLADAPPLTMDVLSWSRHHRLFPGEGAFDLPGFLGHVLRTGYQGPLSLEVFNDVFRQSDADRTALHGLRSLIDLLSSSAPRLEPPQAFTFAEIRAQTTEPVEVMLQQLGFRYRGQHRSRPVRLWTSGSARVVLNEHQLRSPEPALAAVGVDLDDVEATVTRAETLRAPMVFRRVHEGENVLRGVLAPDENEFFLCPADEGAEPLWTSEFHHGSPEQGVQFIHRIDHVNLVQPWEDIAEATLFHRSLLGLQVDGSAQVAGPSGLVTSQVMTNPDHDLRLVLNVAPLGARPGSLAQHVAFATDDIVSLAERAQAAGLSPLPVPGNYYEDVAARFGLEPGFVERLRALRLMYDQDEKGTFMHFYTATVGSVFLEVLQRLDGYDGYGAANAPVRLAAQTRAARG